MKLTRSILALTSSALLAGCVSTRPGSSRPSGPPPLGVALLGVAGAAGGAALGYQVKGQKGAMVGAALGTAATLVTAGAVSKYQNDQLEEAELTGERKARQEIMNEYWKSNAVDATAKKEAASPNRNSAKLQYPAGVYDGVLYGPRVEDVPKS